MIDVELMSRRMSGSAVIALLRDRHGEATACKMARLERLKARRARSRKRFDFWTAVATEMQQGRLAASGAEPELGVPSSAIYAYRVTRPVADDCIEGARLLGVPE